MKTFFFLTLLLIGHLTVSLQLKQAAQAHLMNGRIAGKHNLNHQSYNKQEHKLDMKLQQHAEEAHDGQSYSSSSDWVEFRQRNKNMQYHKNEQIKPQAHQMDQNVHDGASTNKLHRLRVPRPDADTDSYSSSSDWVQVPDTVSYTHQKQLNRDMNAYNNNDMDGQHDQYSDNQDTANMPSNQAHQPQRMYQSHTRQQSHQQNDLDEPNNGAKYYFVDQEQISESTTSDDLQTQSSLSYEEHIDYQNPIVPVSVNAVPTPHTDLVDKTVVVTGDSVYDKGLGNFNAAETNYMPDYKNNMDTDTTIGMDDESSYQSAFRHEKVEQKADQQHDQYSRNQNYHQKTSQIEHQNTQTRREQHDEYSARNDHTTNQQRSLKHRRQTPMN